MINKRNICLVYPEKTSVFDNVHHYYCGIITSPRKNTWSILSGLISSLCLQWLGYSHSEDAATFWNYWMGFFLTRILSWRLRYYDQCWINVGLCIRFCSGNSHISALPNSCSKALDWLQKKDEQCQTRSSGSWVRSRSIWLRKAQNRELTSDRTWGDFFVYYRIWLYWIGAR